MKRCCVIAVRSTGPVVVNDAIGLDPHSDYSIAEYLRDRARDLRRLDGRTAVYLDGTREYLCEVKLLVPGSAAAEVDLFRDAVAEWVHGVRKAQG